ncbi:Uncharacterised protein [Mycobacteroides abscessus subsp. abscessus]|nr:Uncharacterised protein [Mycobacteroides abscessus subsp. abscessus]
MRTGSHSPIVVSDPRTSPVYGSTKTVRVRSDGRSSTLSVTRVVESAFGAGVTDAMLPSG